MHRAASLACALVASLVLQACVVVHEQPRGDGGSSASSAPSRSTTLVRVVNHSSQSISYIYCSPGDEMSWGEDLLSVDVLGPGEECDITLAPGVWDVKCVASDGQELVFWDEHVSGAGTEITIADQ